MPKKRLLISAAAILVGILLNAAVIRYEIPLEDKSVDVEITVSSDVENHFQLFYLTEDQIMPNDFSEQQSKAVLYEEIGQEQTYSYQVPAKTEYLRFDVDSDGNTNILNVAIKYRNNTLKISEEQIALIEQTQDLKVKEENGISIAANGKDPYLIWKVSDWGFKDEVHLAENKMAIPVKIVLCLLIDVILILLLRYGNKLFGLPVELFHNRTLIMNLSKNDFKTKFAGSYLGIVWAFIQPVVTILVYWFVFEKGLHAGGMSTREGIEIPFVLWLTAGIVPWFFFQEAWSTGTNALMEYSYLVKKVVFKISILPIVKVISALFVHAFFVVFVIILFSAYRYYPDLYTLQVIYYSFAMVVFVLALVYITCSVVVFFKDLSQIISIFLQVGVWMTPIMWNIETINIAPGLIKIFKLNPMFYIVSGYRDALINKVWFWEHPQLTLYFWIITFLLFALGAMIFKRLKVHFADVL